jgi:hypothetical protein
VGWGEEGDLLESPGQARSMLHSGSISEAPLISKGGNDLIPRDSKRFQEHLGILSGREFVFSIM